MRYAALILIVMLLISGCGSITKDEAEEKAMEFIKKNVKFFTKEGNSTLDVPQYAIKDVSSYTEGKNFIVVAKISSSFENETKQNDMIVKVNPKGEVIEFNGQEVPKEAR